MTTTGSPTPTTGDERAMLAGFLRTQRVAARPRERIDGQTGR